MATKSTPPIPTKSKSPFRAEDDSAAQRGTRIAKSLSKPDGRQSRAKPGAKSGPRKQSSTGPVKNTRKKDAKRSA